MAAPKENSFWKARSYHGRKPIYSDPDKFYDACCKYFEWIEEHPLFSTKPMVEDKVIRDVPISHMRIMTITGCARYIGMTFNTWTQYREKEDFSNIIKEVEQIIFDQKLSGAAAGLLNANIISRELGLKDSSAVDLKVPEGLTFINNFGGKDEG